MLWINKTSVFTCTGGLRLPIRSSTMRRQHTEGKTHSEATVYGKAATHYHDKDSPSSRIYRYINVGINCVWSKNVSEVKNMFIFQDKHCSREALLAGLKLEEQRAQSPNQTSSQWVSCTCHMSNGCFTLLVWHLNLYKLWLQGEYSPRAQAQLHYFTQTQLNMLPEEHTHKNTVELRMSTTNYYLCKL